MPILIINATCSLWLINELNPYVLLWKVVQNVIVGIKQETSQNVIVGVKVVGINNKYIIISFMYKEKQ